MGLALAKDRPFDGCARSRLADTLGGALSQKRRFALRKIDPITESQLTELRNMRVLLEEARVLARDLAYHRRARLPLPIFYDKVETENQDPKDS
jgi:hypothetical protein